MTEALSRKRLVLFQLRERGGALYSLADQVISSGSNFVLSVLVARAGGPHALGVFGILFLIWLAVLGLNRALVCEPMTVHGSTSGDAGRSEGASASLGLGIVCAVVFAVVTGVLQVSGVSEAGAMFALIPWIPALLLQDYFRLLSFRLGRPDQAFFSDLIFLVVQAAVTGILLLCGSSSLFPLIASWGLGGLAGACFGVARAGLRLRARAGLSLVHGLWRQSRWFVAEFSTSYVATQAYVLILPVLLGAAVFGLYRAGIGLLGPLVIIFVAGGNVGLPGCVKSLRERGRAGLDAYTLRITLAVMAFTFLYCGAVALFAAPLLDFVYGGSFEEAVDTTRLLTLAYTVSALGFGCGLALKAINQLRQLWYLRVVSTAVATVAALLLVHPFDLLGAGWFAVIVTGTYSLGVVICYWRVRLLVSETPVGVAI